MNVTRKDVDALNAVITVDINQEDVAPKVEQVLNDYRKRADIPGFRKGNVPMGIIKKQYGQAVMVDEVNKMLQSSLNDFLNEEKISILGNPLPVPVDNIDWNATAFSFDFDSCFFSWVKFGCFYYWFFELKNRAIIWINSNRNFCFNISSSRYCLVSKTLKK